ncbi:BnaC05g25510D [Brassica napus]|uniref:(rape) hypothetical protein n=1 Tax=Brassica napus TaxID=3708 RepID=A0A078GKJ2_BRANA|nr:unnamed protein product [Brassica napus]CDY25672.1 BnaC05g25510D [Brassica napus]
MSLISKILNPKKQNVEKLIQAMPHQWGLEDRITANDLGNGKFLFNFSSEEDLNSVLRMCPFHYNYFHDDYPWIIPFWVTLTGIPLHLWTDKNLMNIGVRLGHVDTVELMEGRMLIDIDSRVPFKFKRKIQSPEGEEVTIEIKYDMLFKHCTTCGALSHEKGFCSTNSVSSQTQGQHQGRTGVFARVQLPYQSSRQPLLGEKGASDYHSRSAYMARHADNRRGYDDREGLRDSYHVNRSHHEGATFHAWSRDGANQYSHSDRIMRRRDGNGRTHSYGGSRQYSKPYHRNVEQRWCAKQYNGSYNMRREEPERGSQATIIPDGSDINGNSGNDQHVAQHSEDDGKDARHGNKLASEIVTPTSPHSLHMSDNVTVRDRGVSKSLSFSPKAGGDDAIIRALGDMDLTVPQDEHMIDCEVNDDDILGMDLMEMENGHNEKEGGRQRTDSSFMPFK